MQVPNNNGTRFGTILQAILYLTGVPVFNDNSKSYSGVDDGRSGLNVNNIISTPHPEDPLNIKCYGILGCVRIKYESQRGFHLFPEPLQIIKPTICLQLYNNRACQLIEPDTISTMLTSPGSKGKKTSYWIAHGYIDTGHRPWIQKMANQLLEYDNNANVYIIDWGRGAEPPYTQAVMNIELLAAYVGHLMVLIEEEHNLKTIDSHFIGHSLGAHFGGFVGSWLKERGHILGRITGLDPAQPYFQHFGTDVRLDPGDADFVDAIHTDAKPLLAGGSLSGLGTQQPSGHTDFFPNNGREQPGCSDGVYQAILQEKGSLLYGLRRFLGCDHIRSYEIFTESIRSSCSYKSFACPSWDSFISSTCELHCEEGNFKSCNRMGFHAKKPTLENKSSLASSTSKLLTKQFWSDGTNETIPVEYPSILYYSITGNRSPYCREHYLVKLKFAEEEDMDSGGGSWRRSSSSDLNLVILGRKGVVVDKMRLQGRDLRGSLEFQYIVPGNEMMLRNKVEKVVLKPMISNPIWWLVNRMARSNPDITIQSVSIRSVESPLENETTLCPEGKPILSTGSTGSGTGQDTNVILTTQAC